MSNLEAIKYTIIVCLAIFDTEEADRAAGRVMYRELVGLNAQYAIEAKTNPQVYNLYNSNRALLDELYGITG